MDEIKAVITQGQGLVGAALTGATAAVTNNDKEGRTAFYGVL